MFGAQLLLEGILVLLLAATLFHAIRLERALGVLKRDRAVLEGLVTGFNESTQHAEAGVERLRSATEGAGRQIARQIELAQRLRDDLSYLTERGESLAERLDKSVRQARMVSDEAAMAAAPPSALQMTPAAAPPASIPVRRVAPVDAVAAMFPPPGEPAGEARLRSEAERDLLRALRAAR